MISQLDHLFPVFVFGYGALLTFVLNSKPLQQLAEKRIAPDLLAQMHAHRILALLSLIVGGLWSLQRYTL